MKSLRMVVIVLSILLLAMWVTDLNFLKWSLLKSSNDYFTGTATILAAIVAVIGVYLTIKHNNETKKKELLDNLDSKSEWRKQLYDVASKTFLTTDDVYRVLASIRYLPKKVSDMSESEQKHFDYATLIIFNEMYGIINENKENLKRTFEKTKETVKPENLIVFLKIEESEKVRIYTKYLLKHHWEYNSNESKDYKLNEEEKQFNESKLLVQSLHNYKYYSDYLIKMKEYNSKDSFIAILFVLLKRFINKMRKYRYK